MGDRIAAMASRTPRPAGRNPIAAALTAAITDAVASSNDTSNRNAAATRNKRSACMSDERGLDGEQLDGAAQPGARLRVRERRMSETVMRLTPIASAADPNPGCDHSSATPPSTHAEPTQVIPMIAVRLKPRVTRTPPLCRLASRTTTAPGTGRRFAAEPMMLTCTISSAGGWWSAKCAIRGTRGREPVIPARTRARR